MNTEQNALKLSLVGNSVIAAMGIGFFLWTDSEAILLDGFFALISFVMALLSLKVVRLIRQPDDDRFQFGYANFEPALNTIKGLITLIVAGFALASAIDAILDGGRELKLGIAIIYSVVTVGLSLTVVVLLRRAIKHTPSPLLEVEARNWLLGGTLSFGVGVAFLTAVLLQGTRWEHAIPYVDPVLVMVLVLAMAWVPLRTVVESIGDLLMMAPTLQVQRTIRDRCAAALRANGLTNTRMRMVKSGRTLYVLAHVIVPETFRVERIAELDAIRERIDDSIGTDVPHLTVTTVFTETERWAV